MPLFEGTQEKIPTTMLKDRFGWTPFSVLNAASWDWRRRKDEWTELIGDGTQGRDAKRRNATPTNIFSTGRAVEEGGKAPKAISEFDPYLTELMYEWFSIPGMTVFDPFAGGVTRGAVAAVKGRHYMGVDLSETQVDANQRQYQQMQARYSDIAGSAAWICGDAEEVTADMQARKCQIDMILTCPPYFNIEQYSNNAADLSASPDYYTFRRKYAEILRHSAELLAPDSFFVVVVGEVRRSKTDISRSDYVGLVPDTIKILMDAGLCYYNELIMVNSTGSLPVRTPEQFRRARKIGKHHQNVLVFYYGDISHIDSKYNI